MATDPFSNFKATPFVSQYAGLPIEEFAQSAQVLQQRGIQNREQLDKLDMMAYQIQYKILVQLHCIYASHLQMAHGN